MELRRRFGLLVATRQKPRSRRMGYIEVEVREEEEDEEEERAGWWMRNY